MKPYASKIKKGTDAKGKKKTDDRHWILTLYDRYVELFGDPEKEKNKKHLV